MPKPTKHKRTEHVVAVVFRRWPQEGNAILALFPELPADHNGLLCTSYTHTGQHSAAHYDKCIAETGPAKKSEYAALFRELKQRGYNMVVRHRSSKLANQRRHAECVRLQTKATASG